MAQERQGWERGSCGPPRAQGRLWEEGAPHCAPWALLQLVRVSLGAIKGMLCGINWFSFLLQTPFQQQRWLRQTLCLSPWAHGRYVLARPASQVGGGEQGRTKPVFPGSPLCSDWPGRALLSPEVLYWAAVSKSHALSLPPPKGEGRLGTGQQA